jgi:hypothetical protein
MAVMAVLWHWIIAVAVLCGLGFAGPTMGVAGSTEPDPQSVLSPAVSGVQAAPDAQAAPEMQPPERDARGRIKRSAMARAQFMRMHPCPSTGRHRGPCPGYVIDHIVALKRGGADRPGNMQWQTVQEAKEKDKYE